VADTLGPHGIIGVMTPAMNTVIQAELELLRPSGVTNQMRRFRLGGDTVSDDILDETAKLMDCNPTAIAIGLTTDAAPGQYREACRALQGCSWRGRHSHFQRV